MSASPVAIHAAVVDALVRLGTPVDDQGSHEYGWLADDYTELRMHMAGCRPVYAQCTWTDSDWSEFMGTFDPPERRKGIDLTVTCQCGVVQGRAWRYEGGHTALIRAITEA